LHRKSNDYCANNVAEPFAKPPGILCVPRVRTDNWNSFMSITTEPKRSVYLHPFGRASLGQLFTR